MCSCCRAKILQDANQRMAALGTSEATADETALHAALAKVSTCPEVAAGTCSGSALVYAVSRLTRWCLRLIAVYHPAAHISKSLQQQWSCSVKSVNHHMLLVQAKQQLSTPQPGVGTPPQAETGLIKAVAASDTPAPGAARQEAGGDNDAAAAADGLESAMAAFAGAPSLYA